jgi:hypothetical protein
MRCAGRRDGRDQTARDRYARSAAAPLLVLVPIVAWLTLSGPQRVAPPQEGERGSNAALIKSGIDPNVAEWWELTALPRVGEVTAKRIVAYREQHRGQSPDGCVFRAADDLARVHGIGPKTVERLRPFLRFE